MTIEYSGPLEQYALHGVKQLRLPTVDTAAPTLEQVFTCSLFFRFISNHFFFIDFVSHFTRSLQVHQGVAFIERFLKANPGKRVFIHFKGSPALPSSPFSLPPFPGPRRRGLHSRFYQTKPWKASVYPLQGRARPCRRHGHCLLPQEGGREGGTEGGRAQTEGEAACRVNSSGEIRDGARISRVGGEGEREGRSGGDGGGGDGDDDDDDNEGHEEEGEVGREGGREVEKEGRKSTINYYIEREEKSKANVRRETTSRKSVFVCC